MEAVETVSYAQKPWLKHYPKEVPASLEYPEKPVFWILEQAYKEFANKEALIFYDKRTTYEELYNSALYFAGALQSLGVKKGDRVALLLPNCPAYPVAYYGTVKIGAIVAQFNPLYTERELEKLIDDAGAKVAVTLDVLAYKFNDIVAKRKIDKLIIAKLRHFLPFPLNLIAPLKTLKEPKFKAPSGFEVYDFKSLIEKRLTPSPVDIDIYEDVAVFQYTGGTTGLAKAAMLTHRNIVCNTLQVVSWAHMAERGKEVVMCVLPFFHVYGMTVGMNVGFYLGGTLVLEPRFEVERVVKLIEKYKVTLFPGVPTIYVAIYKYVSESSKKVDLSSVKFCLSGGAPLPVEVAEEFECLTGGKVREGYGLSESSPVTHANLPDAPPKKGSIGIPVSDTCAKIVDPETGEDMPVGEPGELCVKGPQVMKGYWNRPEETKKTLDKDGWLHTGDIAYMDEDGYFYIVDRKKDMIIAGGYNIYPREVEEVLYQHPKVLECAVIGVPDEYRGETVKAFIVLKPGETATAEEIIEFCRKHLAAYKVPKLIEFMDELPKSAVGKVLRRILREREEMKRKQKAN